MQNIINDFREVIGEGIDASDYKHLQRDDLLQPLVKQAAVVPKALWKLEEKTYRSKLVVEFRQHGIVGENGGVLLKPLQLVLEALLVFLTPVPRRHWLEKGLSCSIPPLQDHHLREKVQKVCNGCTC